MNPAVITSALTSIVMMALTGVAAKLGWDATTTSTVAGAVVAILLAFGVAIWRAAMRSNNAVLAAAAKIIAPTGGEIVTTPEIANGPLADVKNVVTKS